MFFSQELLSKRESGYGLLWLAATLGSKSSFKKLPKRSIVIADISQLCDLISEPSEPLALRLSSNLMVGVVRVYKVKHEMFVSDVTACFATVKKAMQELVPTSTATDPFLMGQPTVRPDAVTLTGRNSQSAIAMQIECFPENWYETMDSVYENEYSAPRNPKRKSHTEHLRADLHTLEENYDHLLSASFDCMRPMFDTNPSSSQAGLDFGNDIFGDIDLGFDLGLGADIARELGEDWVAPITDPPFNPEWQLSEDAFMGGIVVGDGQDATADYICVDQNSAGRSGRAFSKDRKASLALHECHIFSTEKFTAEQDQRSGDLVSLSIGHPADTVGQNLLPSLDGHPNQAMNEPIINRRAQRKTKHVRFLFDMRTELTDEELKSARMTYLEDQIRLHKEADKKRTEKNIDQVLEVLLWTPPADITDPELKTFWKNGFKAHVSSLATLLDSNSADHRPRKRRRLHTLEDECVVEQTGQFGFEDPFVTNAFDAQYFGGAPVPILDHFYRRSSEEPEQGRRLSRPPSDIFPPFFEINDLGNQTERNFVASQQNAMFPWDNAAPTSSSLMDEMQVVLGPENDEVRVRRRSTSVSRRESSVGLNPLDSAILTPNGLFGRDSATGDRLRLLTTASQLDQTLDMRGSIIGETQGSVANLISLERNAYNFLEYSKMKQQTLPLGVTLKFDDVIPKSECTCHVAAAAFYNCLVLATKDLMGVDQRTSLGPISLFVR